MLIFVVVFSALLFLMHRYVWARLVRDAAWPAPWGRGLTVLVFGLAALIPVALPAMRFTPRFVNAPLSWVVYTWMGFMLYLFLLTVLGDAGRGMAALAGVLPKDPQRRRMLARAIAVAVGVLSGALGVGAGLLVGYQRLVFLFEGV